MNRLSLLVAAGMMAISATSAQAATVFSDTFATTPTTPNWTQNNSGQVVTVAGVNALHFVNGGSGGDLFSSLFAVPGKYTISIDYLCGTAGGCGGYVGLIPGSTATVPATPGNGGDAWLATDTQAAYGAPFLLVGNGTGFTTNAFTFTVTSPGSFGLKLEDFVGSGGVAGDAYFRNLVVSSVPEPATWAMMLMGFGMVGAGVRSRRKQSVRVTYA